MSIREIYEGKQEQGSDETIVYVLDTTQWTTSPSTAVATVYTLKANGSEQDIDQDVTSTVMPSGSVSISGAEITWKALTSLTKGKRYRMEMQFQGSGNTFEAYAIIECTR